MVDENGKAYFGAVLPEKPYEIVVYRITDYGEWMEQTRKQIVYNPMEPIIRIETFNTSVENRLQVPVVLQNPELPNGCEITSLTAILNYYGINVDKMTLSDRMPKLKLYVKNGVRYGP
ncbi:MAG: hypothetical protein GX072_02350, partial [Lysinibacillus sp.]|nr:hypothetical protein [Lysinibacillus sp.]